jgi:hypothetical protein
MLRNIAILIILYIIVSMDFHCFTSFDASCLGAIQDKLYGIFRWSLDLILLIVEQIKKLII